MLASLVASLDATISQLDVTIDADRERLPSLHRDLQAARAMEIRQRRLLLGETSTDGYHQASWMARITAPAQLPPLRLHPDDPVVDTLEAQFQVVHDFYSALFCVSPLDDAATRRVQDELLDPWLVSFASSHVDALGADFSSEDLQLALHHGHDDSAPGPDGLSYQAYRVAALTLCPLLSGFVNHIMQNGQRLPRGVPGIRMVLLPKKGDRSLVANWRPLGVQDVDSRLIGRVWAQRLRHPCCRVIGPHQNGFLPGRSFALALAHVQLRLEDIRAGRSPAMLLLFLDQEKAYDRVSHSWLFKCLEHIGAPSSLITWFQQVYDQPAMLFCLDGHRTPGLYPRTGVLQGAPESPMLYNIVLEPLLDALVREGLFVSAFADDVIVGITDHEELQVFQHWLELFQRASNAKVNTSKSVAYFVAQASLDQYPDLTQSLARDIFDEAELPYQLLSTRHIKHLGAPLSLDGSSHTEFWTKAATTLEAKARCVDPNLPLITVVKVFNSKVLSKLWHCIRATNASFQVHRGFYAKLKSALFRHSSIRRDWVHIPRSLGGLGLIDTWDMSIALFGALLCKLITTSPEFVKALHQHFIDGFGASHAHLFFKVGTKYMLMNKFTLAARSFLDRAVYTLARLGAEVDTEALGDCTLQEYLSLPVMVPHLGTWRAPSGRTMRNDWLLSGLWTYADVLWHYPSGPSEASGTAR
ncbi:unnamed protein product [Sympodiomycopsis kandeliae]